MVSGRPTALYFLYPHVANDSPPLEFEVSVQMQSRGDGHRSLLSPKTVFIKGRVHCFSM